jgi:hypothetical protein
VSQIKNTLFTTIKVVVIPLLFFVMLEGILRLAGVGTHFDYFNEIEINDAIG